MKQYGNDFKTHFDTFHWQVRFFESQYFADYYSAGIYLIKEERDDEKYRIK